MPIKNFDTSADILFFVLVRDNDFASRQFIRNTLGKAQFSTFKIQIMFVFGQSFNPSESDKLSWKNESQTFQDLILTQTEDSYNTVIFKEVNAFIWALKSVKGTFS